MIDEVEENFDSNELYRAKYGSKTDDTIVGAFRNPYIYLPATVRQFGAGPSEIEIVGRLMWHSSGAKNNIEASYRLYRKSEQAYPDLAYVKILRANCLTYLSSDMSAFVDQVEGVKKLHPDFFVRFLLFKRENESKLRSTGKGDDNTDQSLDLVAYVEFQKYYTYILIAFNYFGLDTYQLIVRLKSSTTVQFSLFVNSGHCSFSILSLLMPSTKRLVKLKSIPRKPWLHTKRSLSVILSTSTS